MKDGALPLSLAFIVDANGSPIAVAFDVVSLMFAKQAEAQDASAWSFYRLQIALNLRLVEVFHRRLPYPS
jgi:hypothetical protein